MIHSLGMIARCDQGGLGNQTFEIFKNVQPKFVIVMCLGTAGRGREDREKFIAQANAQGSSVEFINGDRLPDDVLLRLAGKVSKVLSIETFYNDKATGIISKAGAKSVLIANPELYDSRVTPDVLRVPTFWELDRMPRGAKILHHPIDRSFYPFRLRHKAEVFYHPAAPAMKDRNGTDIVVSALKHIQSPCKVIIRSAKPSPFGNETTVGNVEVEWLTGMTPYPWDSYPPEADALLLPRRYGGLCLPLQEASSLGMPAIMTDLAPQFSLPHVETVPVSGSTHVPMKGGTFLVYDVKSADVAAAMDKLIENPMHAESLSYQANKWSQAHSWETLRPSWIGALS